MRAALCLTALAILACGPPIKNVPVADVPKLTSLEEVMDMQATVADPVMKKAGASSYADADWAQFTDASERLQATAGKIKSFTKGPEFDGLADQLGAKAKALGEASAAKDVAKASAALTDMKSTCKGCHSKFR